MRISAWTDNLSVAFMLRSARAYNPECTNLLLHLRKLASTHNFHLVCFFQHRVHRKAVQADSLSNVLFPQPSHTALHVLHDRLGGYPPELILLSCNFLTPETIVNTSQDRTTSVVVLPLGLGPHWMNRIAEYGVSIWPQAPWLVPNRPEARWFSLFTRAPRSFTMNLSAKFWLNYTHLSSFRTKSYILLFPRCGLSGPSAQRGRN